MPTDSGTIEGSQGKGLDLASRIILPIGDISGWAEIDPTASLIVLTGTLRSWASCDAGALLPAIAKFSGDATISLQIEAGEDDENPAALQCMIDIQKQAMSRAYVDFVISPAVTAYPHTELEIGRAAFLSAASSVFQKHGILVRWLIPLCPAVTYKLETLFLQAQELGVEAIIASVESQDLGHNDQLFAADFVRHRILEDEGGLLSPAQRQGYEELLGALDSGDLQEIDGVFIKLLSANSNAVRRGPARRPFSFVEEAAGVLSDGARAHLLRARLTGKPRYKSAASQRFKKVLLIGAYGGEHIGDAAILGGVAFRLHARHGVTKAILMSQRPDHTRHLIPMIETPVDIDVREYRRETINACIDDVDAVIFAGGPFIDLPKQLVLHLYAASRAKLRGKPFLMEGVGPGPFQRLPSKLTARQIISLADFVSVRTQESVDVDIVRGVDVEVGRDPAFDYLATRPRDLKKMLANEPPEIERLLNGASERPVIGVNIRPIYHQYTVGVKGADKASYTKMIEDRFERRFAEALTQFSRNNSTKPVIVFFPMNAVQFGLSDLKSAFRIGRHLGKDIDYRVWEADASLDGVLALIRRLDIAITMRFHATIFALSQGIETIGVDYRIGERDKVAAVLSDAGKGDQCVRIDEMTVEWMTSQLQRLAAAASNQLKTG